METPLVVRWATLGPIGQRLRAPGTWGSLVGVLYFAVCFQYMNVLGNLLASALGAYFAVGMCGEAEIRMGRRDPGEVILDEVVAIPLCFLGWSSFAGWLPSWVVLLAGFGLFRFFDIRKPFFINSLQDLPGGWGIVADDLAAALCACLVLHLAHVAWVLF